jgi:hypothetical protein
LNTPLRNKRQYFTVTETNHIQYGKQYAVNNMSKSFGATLVQYTDDDGLEKSMNVLFTSLHIVQPFKAVCNGRRDFMFDELLLLAEEMRRIRARLA